MLVLGILNVGKSRARVNQFVEQLLRALAVVLVRHAHPEHRDLGDAHGIVAQHVLHDELMREAELVDERERLIGEPACLQALEKFAFGRGVSLR